MDIAVLQILNKHSAGVRLGDCDWNILLAEVGALLGSDDALVAMYLKLKGGEDNVSAEKN